MNRFSRTYFVFFLRTLFLIFASTSATAKIKLPVCPTEYSCSYSSYTNNDEFCSIAVKLILPFDHPIAKTDSTKFYVVPLRLRQILSIEFVKTNAGKSLLSYISRSDNVDLNNQETNKEFAYYLPFEKGTKRRVSQGYNGIFSHRGVNALDFAMKVGTPVCAARGGVVIFVNDENDQGCAKRSCARYNNKLMIHHEDGTIATYLHITHNGSLVKEGDTVEIGQRIALSGNTGWSSSPLLHFSVAESQFGRQTTIRTKFLIGDGSESTYLKAFRVYRREY